MDSLKCLTYNAKGIGLRSKRLEIFNQCKNKGPDILMLQETHSRTNKESVWYRDWGSKIYYSHGNYNAKGVCICFKNSLNYKFHGLRQDKDGRIIILDVSIFDIRITVANIYAPNDDTPSFFTKAFDMVGEFNNDAIIIGGDFNLVLNVELDKKGGRKATHEKCRQLVIKTMMEKGLSDVWRNEHPNLFGYTWRSYSTPYIFCRLDFVIVCEGQLGPSYKNRINPGYRSDHAMVETNFRICTEKRGRGFWKLNCSLLNHKEYIELIEKCIVETVENNPNTEDGLLWETMKCKIRGDSIKFSAALKKADTAKMLELERELTTCRNNLPLCKDTENIQAERIAVLEKEIENITHKKIMGARTRCKVSEYEQGEKSSRYFYSLEKKNQENKTIKLLIADNNKKLYKTSDILKEEIKFYQNLYSSSYSSMVRSGLDTMFMEFVQDFETDMNKCDEIDDI